MLFAILGPVEVRSPAGPLVTTGGPRLRALLALLLLDAGRIVPTERLINGLYGEQPPAEAANALQAQVSRLRRRLRDGGGADLIEFHPAGYRLAVEPDHVDALRFARLAAAGHRALTGGDHAQAALLLREALGLWQGPPLADVADAPFAAAQAARLQEQRVAASEDRAEAELALGEYGGLVAELRDLVAEYPLRERLRGQLMRALYGSGRQAEALAVFEDGRQRLAEELGADPSAELAAVHLAILRAEPTPTPEPARLDTAPARVPAQLTSFVGRDRELDRVGALLGASRLVTLTGPGGTGKTRLAVESAARRPGEVCFVELAPLGTGAEVPQALIGALGLRETGLFAAGSGTPDPVGRLVAALADRDLLLVLDNCEHVIDEAARITRQLLAGCPALRVLATSREALGITGEVLCPVPRLASPPPGTTLPAARDYPAVQLFAARAAAVRPGFAVDAGTVDAVLRICTGLEGLPLAIELAAARLRSLPVAEVAARLDDRFRLLSRGDRTAAHRHQTLHAVVEWSWNLLEAGEQAMARRLTVFAGGATLEAAERVCGLDGADLLTSLADKSLVESTLADSSGPQSTGNRFRMLDTIRAYCAERLTDIGEKDQLHRAHAEYFLGLAVVSEPYLRRAEQVEWIERLNAERGNFHAALRWSVHHDPELGVRLVGALSSYWLLRGLPGEGAAISAELLARIGTEPAAELAEDYVLCVVNAASRSGGGQQLRPHWERARAIMAGFGRPPRQPFTIVMWALAVGPGAAETDQSALQFLFDTEPWSRGLFQLGNGMQQLLGGDLDGAERAFTTSLEVFSSIGERWGMMQALDELAKLAAWRGELARSRELTDRAIEIIGQLGSVEDLADLLYRRADALAAAGELEAASSDYLRAGEIARRTGAPGALAGLHSGLGGLARRRGDLVEARRLFELALGECETGSFLGDTGRATVLIGLGRVAEAECDTDAATSHYRDALAGALRYRYLPVAASAVEGLASVALREGDAERAALLLGASTVVRGAVVANDPDVASIAAEAARLAGSAYSAAFDRGAAMSRPQAFELLGVPADQ